MNSNDTAVSRLIPMIYEGVLDLGIRYAVTLERCSLLGVLGVHGFVRSMGSRQVLYRDATSKHKPALPPLIPCIHCDPPAIEGWQKLLDTTWAVQCFSFFSDLFQ